MQYHQPRSDSADRDRSGHGSLRDRDRSRIAAQEDSGQSTVPESRTPAAHAWSRPVSPGRQVSRKPALRMVPSGRGPLGPSAAAPFLKKRWSELSWRERLFKLHAWAVQGENILGRVEKKILNFGFFNNFHFFVTIGNIIHTKHRVCRNWRVIFVCKWTKKIGRFSKFILNHKIFYFLRKRVKTYGKNVSILWTLSSYSFVRKIFLFPWKYCRWFYHSHIPVIMDLLDW